MIKKIRNLLFTKKIINTIKENKVNVNTCLNRNVCSIIAICITLIIISASFQVDVIAESANPKLTYTMISDDYKEIEHNSRFTLYCNLKTGAFIVKNNETEYLWRSIVDYPEEYALENLSSHWKSYISSLFTINYTDLQKNEGLMEKAFSSTDANITNWNNIKNGISLDYDFTKVGINITIEITLEEDGLIILIPGEKIKENKNFGLVNIELAPYFGAENNNLNGYIFYPDGCGALMKYENSKERPKFIKPYKGFVFAPEKVDIFEYVSMERSQKYNAMFPVYGIKNGDNAFLAIASKGAEETAVLVYPYGYSINLNRAGFEFYYRHFYNTILSNITLRGRDTAKNLSGVKADKDLIIQDHEAYIIFTGKADADYSGMANMYREYLVKNGEIKNTLTAEKNIPLGVNLFMGIKEERMLFDKYISMTSFQEAKTIVEQFKNNGVEALQVSLIGWSQGGYGTYPDMWPPERKLGGATEIKKLFKYANENDIRIFMQTNSIDATNDNRSFSKRNDVVMQGNGLPVTGVNKDRFILNPSAYFRRIKDLMNKATQAGEIGLALEKIGKFLYHDYNKSNPSSRAQTMNTWQETLLLANSLNKPIGVEGGNAYTLKYADYLFNIPVKSSGYHITDETVPFFQMVVHGMIPYTSEPGNLAYDLTIQKLQWIEYGCMPFFELTYEDTTKLKFTKYNRLFNSQYEHWLEAAIDIYKEFNDRLQKIWNAEMIKHEKLNPKLIKISYSNGIVVYINYSDKDTTYDGYKIGAQDYVVIDRKGAVQ